MHEMYNKAQCIVGYGALQFICTLRPSIKYIRELCGGAAPCSAIKSSLGSSVDELSCKAQSKVI